MAINLPMPTRKFWLFALVVLIAAIVVLWWTGRDSNPEVNLGGQIVPPELTPEEKITNLESLVVDRLTQVGNLSELDKNRLPAESQLSVINTTAKEDRQALQAYAATVAAALSAYEAPRESEVKIVLKALDTRDGEAVNALAATQLKYQDTINKLKTMSVPGSAKDIHLVIINTLERMRALLGPMQEVLAEPALALQASQEYLKANLQFIVAIQVLNQYFSQQNLTFSEREQVKINPTGQ